jgi:hypothetical protein
MKMPVKFENVLENLAFVSQLAFQDVHASFSLYKCCFQILESLHIRK